MEPAAVFPCNASGIEHPGQVQRDAKEMPSAPWSKLIRTKEAGAGRDDIAFCPELSVRAVWAEPTTIRCASVRTEPAIGARPAQSRRRPDKSRLGATRALERRFVAA
jgi:hypothetical protein